MTEFANTDRLECLRKDLAEVPDLELAVLIGSQANGKSHGGSDWDIAVQWKAGLPLLELLGKTEALRRRISHVLGTTEAEIDLIDLPSARLAIKSVVAEEGVPLKGENSLCWPHFLSRTWREIEEFYWEKVYAA